jgi:phosphotransferase system enzyme I (PtsI)
MNTQNDAKTIIESNLSGDLIEVFAGEKGGTVSQRRKVKELTEKMGDEIYKEIISFLTNENIQDPAEARSLYEKICSHRKYLEKKLKRKVGIHVASLDYMENIEDMMEKPVLIERDKMREIAQKAVKDASTDTFNRELLNLNIDKEIRRQERYGSPFSILFMDIDNFKKINDRYGHATGDRVLSKLSSLVKQNIRRTDTIYRYGGDEFVLLLPETHIFEAKQLAMKLMDILKSKSMEEIDGTLNICLGIASFGSAGIDTRSALMEAADKALYEAKRAGKNRACLYAEHGIESVVGPDDRHHKNRAKQIILKGVALSPGKSIGSVFHYRDVLSRKMTQFSIEPEELPVEMGRVKEALRKVKSDLMNMRNRTREEIGKEHAAIFDAHRLILDDDSIEREIEHEMKARLINADHAVRYVFERLENRMRHAYPVKQNSYDIEDISRRLLHALRGVEANVLAHIPENTVIFAERLLPSDTVHLDRKKTKAIVTKMGSPHAHSAILARAMKIPAVSRVNIDMDSVVDRTPVIVDGYSGKVIINPERHLRVSLGGEQVKEVTQPDTKVHDRPVYIGGEQVKVQANIGSVEDAEESRVYNADGIGLYRIEHTNMTASILPDETTLTAQIERTIQKVRGMQINLRLLDIGSDKMLPYLDIREEHNAALGLRGVRLLLRYPELLKIQLKTALMLSISHDIRILIPFVSLPDEIIKVREMLKKLKTELFAMDAARKKDIPVGAMIETPSSILRIEEIHRHSDFISIGTNDLVQYVMAADRENQELTDYYEAGNRVVVEWIERVLKIAREQGIECSLCGELAADHRFTKDFLGMGLRNFSVSPHLIGEVRERIRKISKT